MNMDAFTSGSGMSVVWFNHFILLITGTLMVIAAAAIIMMLKHHMDDVGNHEWAMAYILLTLGLVVVFLGFLNVFWR